MLTDQLDFDRLYGTDTDGEIPVELLDHGAETVAQAVSYEASDPAAFRYMVGQLPIRPADYVFLDLGSGKGRVVLLAAELPFASVIGVEASPALHATACRNVRAWARAGNDGRRVRLRNEDASRTELPEQPCVLYLFNPFRERAVARLLLNLKGSLQGNPRDVWIVYYNPQFGYMLEAAPWLARVARGRGFQQGDYAIWRVHGELAGARRARAPRQSRS